MHVAMMPTDNSGGMWIQFDASSFKPANPSTAARPNSQVAQIGERAREHHVERAQAENREHVRAVDDERLLGDRERRWHRVDREHDIGELDRDQCEEQRGRDATALDVRDELVAVELAGPRDVTLEPEQDSVLARAPRAP